jgi:hypothetical protein
MKKSIRHGAVVRCDIPGCDETFTTYSVSSLARVQAAAVGFKRLKMGGAAWMGGLRPGLQEVEGAGRVQGARAEAAHGGQ